MALPFRLKEQKLTVNRELAFAARRIKALAGRLPEGERPDVATAWRRLSSEIAEMPENEARATIVDWLEQMELQCSAANFIARSDPRTKV